MNTFAKGCLVAASVLVGTLLAGCASDDIVVDSPPDYTKLIYLINMECDETGIRCMPLTNLEGGEMPLTHYWEPQDCFNSSQVIGQAYRPRLSRGHNVWAQCVYIKTEELDVMLPLSSWEDWWTTNEGIWFRNWAISQSKILMNR